MATAFLRDDIIELHSDPTHPEQAERLASLTQALEASELASVLRTLPLRPARESEIAAVHRGQMLERTQMLALDGGGRLDADTYVTPDSWQVACHAAGTVITATEAVVGGTVANAFAVVRPPGHHATATRAMGFCLVNNVAVAAQYALDHLGVKRIAIIDWDVHHGNGTQDIFYGNAQVLYCSTHNYPFYPGTGHWQEMGQGVGYGTTLNVPLPPGTDETAFVRTYDELIIPALRRFEPDMIMVSAGYDAHWADPLGAMLVSTTGYALVATKVYNLAADVCGGRIVCALEGGYHPPALVECIIATLQVLRGRPDLVHNGLGVQAEQPVDIARLIATIQHQHPLLQS
ncbi:MAG: histone deacetylase [Herpetosiphonaceae bacterium]|nr:histone deacetylase [Herpetosiphonaceae bacterium]